jgi:cell division septal protein FtsQ
VRLPSEPALKLTEPLIGHNLWDVNVSSLADSLMRQQPQLKRVRAIRVIPNTIEIEVVRRVPAGQIRLGQWHAVDDEGFVFPAVDAQPRADLIAIKGVEESKPAIRPGQVSENAQLQAALRVIARLKQAPALPGLKVAAVDVRDPHQINVLLDQDIEVRFGGEGDLLAQLGRLRAVAKMITKDPLAVRYVDVRFADPVIGPRIP